MTGPSPHAAQFHFRARTATSLPNTLASPPQSRRFRGPSPTKRRPRPRATHSRILPSPSAPPARAAPPPPPPVILHRACRAAAPAAAAVATVDAPPGGAAGVAENLRPSPVDPIETPELTTPRPPLRRPRPDESGRDGVGERSRSSSDRRRAESSARGRRVRRRISLGAVTPGLIGRRSGEEEEEGTARSASCERLRGMPPGVVARDVGSMRDSIEESPLFAQDAGGVFSDEGGVNQEEGSTRRNCGQRLGNSREGDDEVAVASQEHGCQDEEVDIDVDVAQVRSAEFTGSGKKASPGSALSSVLRGTGSRSGDLFSCQASLDMCTVNLDSGENPEAGQPSSQKPRATFEQEAVRSASQRRESVSHIPAGDAMCEKRVEPYSQGVGISPVASVGQGAAPRTSVGSNGVTRTGEESNFDQNQLVCIDPESPVVRVGPDTSHAASIAQVDVPRTSVRSDGVTKTVEKSHFGKNQLACVDPESPVARFDLRADESLGLASSGDRFSAALELSLQMPTPTVESAPAHVDSVGGTDDGEVLKTPVTFDARPETRQLETEENAGLNASLDAMLAKSGARLSAAAKVALASPQATPKSVREAGNEEQSKQVDGPISETRASTPRYIRLSFSSSPNPDEPGSENERQSKEPDGRSLSGPDTSTRSPVPEGQAVDDAEKGSSLPKFTSSSSDVVDRCNSQRKVRGRPLFACPVRFVGAGKRGRSGVTGAGVMYVVNEITKQQKDDVSSASTEPPAEEKPCVWDGEERSRKDGSDCYRDNDSGNDANDTSRFFDASKVEENSDDEGDKNELDDPLGIKPVRVHRRVPRFFDSDDDQDTDEKD